MMAFGGISGGNDRSMRCAGLLSWMPSELHVL